MFSLKLSQLLPIFIAGIVLTSCKLDDPEFNDVHKIDAYPHILTLDSVTAKAVIKMYGNKHEITDANINNFTGGLDHHIFTDEALTAGMDSIKFVSKDTVLMAYNYKAIASIDNGMYIFTSPGGAAALADDKMFAILKYTKLTPGSSMPFGDATYFMQWIAYGDEKALQMPRLAYKVTTPGKGQTISVTTLGNESNEFNDAYIQTQGPKDTVAFIAYRLVYTQKQ
jgi:hypothetical protein